MKPRRPPLIGDDVRSEGKSYFRLGTWIVLALAVPLLPFVGFGSGIEARFTSWLDAAIPSNMAAMLVIGLLAADILLPVPSSVVIAFAGKMLGFWGGTIAAWCGMTAGAVIAFGLTRWFGRPMALRFAAESDLQRMDALASRVGVLVLTLARPVPILAEASVLLMGTTRLEWWHFLAAVSLSNLGIAAAYAALGDSASVSVVLIASISLPLLAGGIARLLWPDTNLQPSTAGQQSGDGSPSSFRSPVGR